MSDNSNFEVNAERIYDNLELLEKGRVYELQKAPGVPKCATLANRMIVLNIFKKKFLYNR